MSSKKKNQLTTSSEWAKHLRKIGKRFFWKGERLAEKGMIKKEKDIISEGFVKTEVDEKIKSIAKKLRVLKNADKDFAIFGAAHHQYESGITISQSELIDFEKAHNIILPYDFRTFVLAFGHGGCGPFYGLLSLQKGVLELPQNTQQSAINKLSAPFRFDTLWNVENIEGDSDFQQDEYDDVKWCDGMLRICHEGCGYFINLVVTGEQRGNLWLDGRVSEAGIFPIDYYGTGKPVKFLDWYLVWLDASIKKLQEKLP
jgi:hypothetical protein